MRKRGRGLGWCLYIGRDAMSVEPRWSVVAGCWQLRIVSTGQRSIMTLISGEQMWLSAIVILFCRTERTSICSTGQLTLVFMPSPTCTLKMFRPDMLIRSSSTKNTTDYPSTPTSPWCICSSQSTSPVSISGICQVLWWSLHRDIHLTFHLNVCLCKFCRAIDYI